MADIGAVEWKTFEQYSVYLPTDVEVECCSLDVYEFVFDLPGKHHYVTICAYEEDSDALDDEVEFLRLNEVPRSSTAAGEKVKWSCANKFRQWTGIDWFIDKRLSDRRLVVEHRHQSEGCEGVSCYCELDGGPVVVLYVRGSGAISCDEIDYFLQVCKKIEVKVKVEGTVAETETCEHGRCGGLKICALLGREGSGLIATVNHHSRSCLWYNFRHEKLPRQSSQPVLPPD